MRGGGGGFIPTGTGEGGAPGKNARKELRKKEVKSREEADGGHGA